MGAISGASAGVLNITSGGIYSSNQLTVNGKSEYATALELTVQGQSNPIWVFCVDLSHIIHVNQLAYIPALLYRTGPVTTDSTDGLSGPGNPLSLLTSAKIQTLANIGVGLAKGSDPNKWDKLTGIQGAIWEIEYGFSPAQVTGTAAQNALISNYVLYAQMHHAASYANGLYSTDASGQGFGTSQGFTTGVHEPSTWAMMLLGFGGIGFFGLSSEVEASLADCLIVRSIFQSRRRLRAAFVWALQLGRSDLNSEDARRRWLHRVPSQ
jgi:hypothetical protein